MAQGFRQSLCGDLVLKCVVLTETACGIQLAAELVWGAQGGFTPGLVPWHRRLEGWPQLAPSLSTWSLGLRVVSGVHLCSHCVVCPAGGCSSHCGSELPQTESRMGPEMDALISTVFYWLKQ